MDTSWEFPADVGQTGIHLGLRRFDGEYVFASNLLLNEGAGDQLLQSPLRGENAESGLTGVEHRQADLVIDVAGQDGVIVDNRNDAVEDHGWSGGWRLCRDLRKSGQREANRQDRTAAWTGCVRKPNWGPISHQKVCPRLKKKLK